MATKSRAKIKSPTTSEVVAPTQWNDNLNNKSVTTSSVSNRRIPSWAMTLGIVFILVGLWWWKTNTWPIVAVVDGKPITRYAVDKELFAQSGQSVVESLITQQQIENELNKQKITVDAKEIDSRIDEIKQTLPAGSSLEEELKTRGMDINKFRNLLSIQLRLNKAVQSQATVSAQELDQYVKDNASFLTGSNDAEKRKNAEAALMQEKSNSLISTWVADAQKKGNVWRLWPLPTTAPMPAVPTAAPQPTPTPVKK